MLYGADARLLCPFCYTKEDIAAQQRSGTGGCGAALIGALANVVPFLVQAVASLRGAADDAVASAHHDWVAFGAGGVAVACGGIAIAWARSRASGGWLAIGALVVMLGVFHIARGTGITG